MNELTALERQGKLLTLTLRRAAARNALSVELLESVRDRLEQIRARGESGVLVLAGEGPVFCAGADLDQLIRDESGSVKLFRLLAEVSLTIAELDMIVIARIQGAAIGGGCQLACACDLSITHTEAKIGFPEVDLGLCAAVVVPWLSRRIGVGRAGDVVLRGGIMSGQEAAIAGIVSESVAAPDALDAAVAQRAHKISAGGLAQSLVTKRILNAISPTRDRQTLLRAADETARAIAPAARRAALTAQLGR